MCLGDISVFICRSVPPENIFPGGIETFWDELHPQKIFCKVRIRLSPDVDGIWLAGRVLTPVLPKLLFLRFLWYSPDIKNIIFSKNLFSSTKIDKVFFELSRVINYPHSVKPDFFIIFFHNFYRYKSIIMVNAQLLGIIFVHIKNSNSSPLKIIRRI